MQVAQHDCLRREGRQGSVHNGRLGGDDRVRHLSVPRVAPSRRSGGPRTIRSQGAPRAGAHTTRTRLPRRRRGPLPHTPPGPPASPHPSTSPRPPPPPPTPPTPPPP